MSIQIVNAVLADFIKDEKEGVLVIKGAWGVGKTQAWSNALKANKGSLSRKQYAYVSLFGLSSTAQLKASIVSKSIPTSILNDAFSWPTLNKHWFEIGRSWVKKSGKWWNAIKGAIPHLKDLSISFEQVADFFISDLLICIDDFERSKLPADELLGLINEFKVEKKCKVVLIMNDERLPGDSKKIYAEYREKIIDFELIYRPTTAEAIDIMLPTDFPDSGQVRKSLLALDVRNFRQISKTLSLLKALHPLCQSESLGIREQVITTVVLLVWVHYGETSPKKPTIEFIRGWNSLGRALRDKKIKGENAEPENEWAGVLNGYGYSSTDELDLALDQVVVQGFVEGSQVVAEILRKNDAEKEADTAGALERAWRLFHDSFEDNEDEILKAMEEGLRRSVQTVAPMNLNSTITLFRKLDKGQTADSLIEYFIEKHRDNPKVFDLENSAFGGEVTDEVIRKRFAEELKREVKLPTIFEAVTNAAKNQGWTKQDEQVLSAATTNDIMKIVDEAEGEKAAEFLRACHWFGSIGGKDAFRNEFIAAMRKIGARSRLNAARVRKFGVEPIDETETEIRGKELA